MIKAIIFDCFGVLTIDRWGDFSSSLAPNLSREASSIVSAYDAGILSQDQLVHQIVELTNQDEQKIRYAIQPGNSKNSQLFEHIKKLKNQNYKIAILSNINDDWITRVFLDEKEQKLFDEIICSYQLGITKPDQRIYQFACQKLAVDSSQAVFVDDKLNFCSSAESLGMYSVHYTNFEDFIAELDKIIKQS